MKKLILLVAVILIAGFTYGQTKQKGVLLGIHTVSSVLSPGISLDQYLVFVKDKLIPAYEKKFYGTEVLSFKKQKGRMC